MKYGKNRLKEKKNPLGKWRIHGCPNPLEQPNFARSHLTVLTFPLAVWTSLLFRNWAAQEVTQQI